MADARHWPSGLRASLYSRTILLASALVLVTAASLSAVLIQAVNARVEQNTVARLRDGAGSFRGTLDDERQTLYAVGSILTSEPAFARAVQSGNSAAVHEWLRLILRDPIDQAALLSGDGKVLDSAVSVGSFSTNGGVSQPLRQALDGQASDTWVFDGAFEQQVFLPVKGAPGTETYVVCLVSIVDEGELDRFRLRTGLDASIFQGDRRIATTLREADDTRTARPALAGVVTSVQAQGTDMAYSVELPSGQMRSYYSPLRAHDGSVVGMFSVSLPLSAVFGEFGGALWPALPLTLFILVCGAFVAFWLTRRLTVPMLLLAQSAARLRAGDLSTPVPPVHEPEFAPLRDELEQARLNLKANMQAVESREATERALLSAVRDPVLVTTAEGTVSLFNAAAAAWFGGAFRLSNRSILEVLPFLPAGAFGQPEGVWQGKLSTDRGREVDLEAVKGRIEVDGSPPMHVYVVHDISQHAELNRLREQLLYDVAHELRGPMGILDNALDIVATDYGSLSTSEFESLMGSARRTVTRLHQLMEDLLGAGSIQAGRFQVDPRPTELGVVISAVNEAVEPLLQNRNQHLDVSTVDESIVVLADRRYVRNALVNLLTNASKYSPEGACIEVTAQEVQGDLKISVFDQGPGISADGQAELFDRFYRVREKGERGIGLGLAIVKGIIEAHGGKVGVSSQPGTGSEFWFTLPLASAARSRTETPVEADRI